jgi:hypothetical protein
MGQGPFELPKLLVDFSRKGEQAMNAAVTMERVGETSPRLKARIAGAFSLLAMLLGIFASFVAHGRLSFVAQFLASLWNIAVTLLLCEIFKPVNKSLALLAAFFGLFVSTVGALEWHPQGVDIGLLALAFDCLLIGYLILRSTFLPRILGALMALAGLAWLTVLLPPLAHALPPYNLAAGVLGQASLTLWLLVMGVNVQRWKDRASAAGMHA